VTGRIVNVVESMFKDSISPRSASCILRAAGFAMIFGLRKLKEAKKAVSKLAYFAYYSSLISLACRRCLHHSSLIGTASFRSWTTGKQYG